jgi:chromatin segregation and condensation protein Rec8/ScpA/Scc1 (kleisin family)
MRNEEERQFPRVSLNDRIAEVQAALALHTLVSFGWLIGGCETRADVVITFLVILELFRTRRARLKQDQLFGEIWLTLPNDR